MGMTARKFGGRIADRLVEPGDVLSPRVRKNTMVPLHWQPPQIKSALTGGAPTVPKIRRVPGLVRPDMCRPRAVRMMMAHGVSSGSCRPGVGVLGVAVTRAGAGGRNKQG